MRAILSMWWEKMYYTKKLNRKKNSKLINNTSKEHTKETKNNKWASMHYSEKYVIGKIKRCARARSRSLKKKCGRKQKTHTWLAYIHSMWFMVNHSLEFEIAVSCGCKQSSSACIFIAECNNTKTAPTFNTFCFHFLSKFFSNIFSLSKRKHRKTIE